MKTVTGTVHFSNCFRIEIITPDRLLYTAILKEEHLKRFKDQFTPGDLVTVSVVSEQSNLSYKIVSLSKLYLVKEEYKEAISV